MFSLFKNNLCVIYFIETLEAETQNRTAYDEMLVDLVEDIQLRIDSGRW